MFRFSYLGLTVVACTAKAIDLDPKYVKAYYRYVLL